MQARVAKVRLIRELVARGAPRVGALLLFVVAMGVVRPLTGGRAATVVSGGFSAARAACSPREPFDPPVVARLAASGIFVYDRRHDLAIVVSPPSGIASTAVSIAEFDASTGAAVRSGRIATKPIAPSSQSGHAAVLIDATYVAVDETAGRLFVLHEPYAVSNSPAGRVDVIDERTLSVLRSVAVGAIARPPAVDERTGRVFIANQQSGTISVLDARTGKLLRTVSVAGGALGPSAPPIVDERRSRVYFAAAARPGYVVILDARSGAVLHRVALRGAPRAIAEDQRAGRVLVSSPDRISVLSADSGTLLHTVAVQGTMTALVVDDASHHAFASYDSSVYVTMLDATTGTLLRTVAVRLDRTLPGGRIPRPDQAESETYPVVDRVDEQRRWVVVSVPAVVSDDGPERDLAQVSVLDSRTATRIHTVFSERAWPDALAVDDQRGRAFSDVGGTIDVYDISCLTSYYIFGDMG